MRRTLSVCLSVRPVIVFVYFTVEPSYERTSKIEKLLFSLMGQRRVCTFRHAQRAAYRTAISAAQILVFLVEVAAATGPESGPDCRRIRVDNTAMPRSCRDLFDHFCSLSQALPSQGYFWVERDISPALYTNFLPLRLEERSW